MAAKEFRINNLARRELHAESCILALPPSLSLSIHGVEKHVRGAKVRGNYLSKRFVSFRSATGFHATTSSSSSSSSSNFDLRTAYSILFDANMRERKAVVVTTLLRGNFYPFLRREHARNCTISKRVGEIIIEIESHRDFFRHPV